MPFTIAASTSRQSQIVPVRYASGAKPCMLDSDPTPHFLASPAAWRGLGVSWCCPITSAPASSSALAAAFSFGGSYQVLVQTTLIFALGLTDWTPRANALPPAP